MSRRNTRFTIMLLLWNLLVTGLFCVRVWTSCDSGTITGLTLMGQYEGTCLLQSHSMLPWTDARDFCDRHGGALIKLPPQGKYNVLKPSLKRLSVCFWIGANDRDRHGHWRWLDGSAVNSDDLPEIWFEPAGGFWSVMNKLLDLHCAQLCTPTGRDDSKIRYIQVKCSEEARFICEIDAVSKQNSPEPKIIDGEVTVQVSVSPTSKRAEATVVPVSQTPEATATLESIQKPTRRRRRRRSQVQVYQKLTKFSSRRMMTSPTLNVTAIIASVCARHCSQASPACSLFNFHPDKFLCVGYSSPDVLYENTEPEKGWEVWRVFN